MCDFEKAKSLEPEAAESDFHILRFCECLVLILKAAGPPAQEPLRSSERKFVWNHNPLLENPRKT